MQFPLQHVGSVPAFLLLQQFFYCTVPMALPGSLFSTPNSGPSMQAAPQQPSNLTTLLPLSSSSVTA